MRRGGGCRAAGTPPSSGSAPARCGCKRRSQSASGESFLDFRTGFTGALDSSFGTAGSIDTVFPASGHQGSEAHAIGLDANGDLVTAGFAYAGSKQNAAVARMSGTSGALDSTFEGPSGSGAGTVQLAITSDSDEATGLAFQSDGKLVLAGWSTVNGSSETSFIVRLLP